MRDLKTALMQRMLGAELTEHLGYEHGQKPPPVQSNRRNGVSRKTLRSEDGLLEIEVPRDRKGSFAPRLIAKDKTRLDGLDDKIIALCISRRADLQHGCDRQDLRCVRWYPFSARATSRRRVDASAGSAARQPEQTLPA